MNCYFIDTFLGLVEAIFEVPSGGWADRFGRKKLFLIGMLALILGYSFYLIFEQYYYFIISSFFLGFGYAVISGNLEALIHDNLEEVGEEKEFDKIQSNQSVFMYLGRASSSLFAGYLYFYGQTLPYLVTIICFIIAMILVLFMHSPKQELSHESNNLVHIKKALIFLWHRKNMVLVILFVGFILSGIGNIYWSTYQPYLEKIGVNISNIGIVYFFISIFSAIGSYFIKSIKLKNDTFDIIKFMLFTLFFISLMFDYIDNIFGIIPILLLSVGFGFIMFLGNTYLIKESPKTHKSTILSIFSLSGSLGYFFFSGISGYIVQFFSLKFLYGLLPILVLISFIFYLISIKNIEKD